MPQKNGFVRAIALILCSGAAATVFTTANEIRFLVLFLVSIQFDAEC